MRAPKPCGTNAAYQRHLLHGEDPCEACRKAHAAYSNQWNRTGPARPRSQARCGTAADYERHWRNKQQACAACLEAWNAYQRRRRQERAEMAAADALDAAREQALVAQRRAVWLASR